MGEKKRTNKLRPQIISCYIVAMKANKYIPSINTLAPDRHLWSLSRENVSGVIREGVEPTLAKAMKAIRAAKKEHAGK